LQQFDKAVEDVRKLKVKPTDPELLQLYALFKQATMGDNKTGNCVFN
jgi:diazepam binding inhibitor-like protein